MQVHRLVLALVEALILADVLALVEALVLADVLALVDALVLAEVLALVDALVPVSYTHLDVYKRQIVALKALLSPVA